MVCFLKCLCIYIYIYINVNICHFPWPPTFCSWEGAAIKSCVHAPHIEDREPRDLDTQSLGTDHLHAPGTDEVRAPGGVNTLDHQLVTPWKWNGNALQLYCYNVLLLFTKFNIIKILCFYIIYYKSINNIIHILFSKYNIMVN